MMKMKVRELIDKLLDLAIEHEDADIYVLGEDDDEITWYRLANSEKGIVTGKHEYRDWET